MTASHIPCDMARSAASFFSPPTVENEVPRTVKSDEGAAQVCRTPEGDSCRTTDLWSNTVLTDNQREDLIRGYGELIELCMGLAHGPVRLGWLLEAHRAREHMYALINGRSREAVRRDEIRKGLI